MCFGKDIITRHIDVRDLKMQKLSKTSKDILLKAKEKGFVYSAGTQFDKYLLCNGYLKFELLPFSGVASYPVLVLTEKGKAYLDSTK